MTVNMNRPNHVPVHARLRLRLSTHPTKLPPNRLIVVVVKKRKARKWRSDKELVASVDSFDSSVIVQIRATNLGSFYVTQQAN